MSDKEYFSQLYEIASHLNKEFSLPATLRVALEKTVELLSLETGWIWLVEPNAKSVYLAASYNLPPALSDYPERLSGWCYCIEKYLSDVLAEGRNISEITCSRLKDIKSGTRDLRFHATIPITTLGQKVGLLNLVSREIQQFSERDLSLLNTISELIGMAIQRTRIQESYSNQPSLREGALREVLQRVLQPSMKTLVTDLQQTVSLLNEKDTAKAIQVINHLVNTTSQLQNQLEAIADETEQKQEDGKQSETIMYPTSPLTKRELQVLQQVRKGLGNREIGEQLYIAERTVKFHLTSILSKLNAKNRTEAVNNAIQRGIMGN